MPIEWSTTVAKRLLPFPGRGVALKPRPAAALAAAIGEALPASLSEDVEVERGVRLGIHRRYDDQGRHLRSAVAPALVDAWVQREGLAFATAVLARVCREPVPATPASPHPRAYQLRHDGEPWRRLRQHLAATTSAGAPLAAAQSARAGAPGELGAALAYAFCEPAWVAAELEDAFARGYGRMAVLAAITDPALALSAGERLVSLRPRYQLYEEAVPHVPTLAQTMGDAGRGVVEAMVAGAYGTGVRKPFAELLACYR